MRLVALLLSSVFLTSLSVKASENTELVCGEDKTPVECKAYLSGLVDGYIASKQKYLPTKPEFESKYLDRAFANRVSLARYDQGKAKPACLPDDVDKLRAIKHLIENGSDTELSEELGNYLRNRYACSSN